MSLTPDPTSNIQQYTTLAYRVDVVERDVKDLRAVIQTYVPQKENELQLRIIRDAVDRVERSVSVLQKSVSDPETGMQKQIQDQKESQDKLLIRILWSVLAGFGTVIIGVAIYYFTHLP